MIGETEWIDESSNLSMQSAEFGELPLEKLDGEKSGASLDSQLDRSRGGLNLAVSRVLKVGSNSSWSAGSQKRFRCPSTDQSVSSAKRPRTRAAGRASGPSPSSSGFQSERKAPVNFADILRETKERNIQKRERYSSVDEPPPLNRGGGRVSECGNTLSHKGAQWSGSSCEQVSWVQKCFPSKGQKDVEARQESYFSANVSAIRPLDAKENPSKVSARGKPRQSQHKIKTNSVIQDESRVSQPASQEDNITMHATAGYQVSNTEQCKKICSESKSLKKLEAPEGINMVINVDPTISKHNTTKNQVWEMKQNAIIGNSKSSPDFLVWGESRRSMVANLNTYTDSTYEKCSSIKPAPQSNTIVPAISPPSTTPALSQGNESMSIEGTTTASFILTKGTHDYINSRTTPTPSLSLTDAIHIPLPSRGPDQPDMKHLTKQHPECQVTPSVQTLLPNIVPNRRESRMQHMCRGRGRGTMQHMGRGRARNIMQHMGGGRGRDPMKHMGRGRGRGRGSGSGNRGHFQTSSEKVCLTEHRISKRIRQLSIAKKTAGYLNYLRAVPRDQRGNSDPRTPDPTERISKRRFDGKVRVWRRRLHEWDA